MRRVATHSNGVLVKCRENEATGVYFLYMRIANKAATQTKTPVRRVWLKTVEDFAYVEYKRQKIG
jgi:hypothetical protein